MNKGKSFYMFQFSCAPQTVDTLIKGWLNANGFTFQNKYGEDLYYCYDAWYGNRGFQYTISDNTVKIFAWTIGMGKQFYMLDSGAVNNMAGDSYKQLLSTLFAGIHQLSAAAPASESPTPVQTPVPEQGPSVSQVVSNMNDEITKKAERACEIGFWMSLAGLLLSFLGLTYGLIIYMFIFYFASQGLKTRKKGKAIASMILAGLSIAITVAVMVLSAL